MRFADEPARDVNVHVQRDRLAHLFGERDARALREP
jgi:hypothetical protein